MRLDYQVPVPHVFEGVLGEAGFQNSLVFHVAVDL